MAVTADDLFGTGAVVGRDKNDGVIEVSRHPELRQDTSDLAVHPVDHRGVNRHFRRLERPLLFNEFVPSDRVAHLARPDPLLELQFRQIPLGDRPGVAAPIMNR